MAQVRAALGLDVGGVLMARAEDGEDTTFLGKGYRDTPSTPGMFEAVGRLVAERFADQVFIVSRCSERTERKTRNWLAHNRFYERTGVLLAHIRFCRQRVEKGPICRELGITHFVDDHLEVLGYLTGGEERILFCPPLTESSPSETDPPGVHRVNSWAELTAHLLPP